MSTKVGKLPYDEPPMYLQRPSSGRSQDVTHVLARTFRDIFTRDLVEQETVKNLNKSRSGDDSYHEKYVEELRKVQAERERRMAEAAMLERHIMQARAKAMAEDEKILNQAAEGCDIYHDLGLPPVQSNLKGCLDSDLLRSHGLIVPEDFSTAEPPLTHAPQAGIMPHYAEATQTSTKHTEGGEKGHLHDAPDNGHHFKKRLGKSESKNKWREMTSPQTRERNRKDMAIVFNKSNFLRNPRHRPPSSQGGGRTLVNPNTITHQLGGAKSTVIDTGKKEPSVVFVPSPSTIVFSDYKVGQVYEMTLDLKNVSAASRPLRVLPPKTEYFAVGLGKFPGEEGIVAPGMSCQYNIRFMPDALMDFEDELTVNTQASQPVTVKLLGKRPPPLLTLSPIVDCGHCLVDGTSTTEFLVKNLGGSGRFCVMPRKCWPATNFSSVATGDKVNLRPFQLYPAVFEIMEGHAIPLQVSFKPTDTQVYEEEITIVCDNCTVKHFILKGEGQRARVQLESASGSQTHPTPGELTDVSAKNHIRFEDINPMTYVTEELTIRNLTNVELPFHWQLVRSSPECRDPFQEEKKDGHQISRVADERNVFCINMEKGVLPPSGTAVTSVAFAPPKMGQFESVLQLVLKNIPRPATRKAKASSSPPSSSSSQSNDASKQPPVCSTPRPTSHTASQAFITQTEDGGDDGGDGDGGGGDGGGGGGSGSDVGMVDGGVGEHAEEGDSLGLEVELKGLCKEYEVLVQPYAIFLPGQVLQSTATRRKFTMLNYSKFPVVFHWSSLKDSHIIEVQTPEGQIPPESSVELEMTIIGGHPGHIDHTLHCEIDHQESTVPLRVVADVKGPEVSIETPSLDFGLVRLGQMVRKQFYLTNESQISAQWNLRESEEFLLKDQQSGQAVSEFTITPSSGELGPLLSVLVEVVLDPTRHRQIDSVMELTVEGGKTRYVGVYGEVQSPQVCVLESTLELPEVYQGIPVTHTVQLFNQTMLPASYQWQQPKGKQSSICSVTFDPEQGILGPHEQLPVSITIVAKEQGPLSEVWIPCLVSGMVKPIFLALVADVQGLRVTYRTPDIRPSTAMDTGERLLEEPSDEDSPLALDFGDDVELATTPKRLVYLTNHTAIPAPFSLTVDTYTAGKPPTPPQTDRPTADSPRRHGALLSRTANLADPRSKSLAQSQSDCMKAILREGQGAAFLVQPCSGVLEPFATLEVSVTVYSDMWGDYTDKLNCKVSHLDPVYIPISMGVTGCPLKFQMATIKGQIPFVRFGTHICGVPAINRPLKIMNNSPYEMRVDWRLFNLVEDDRKLIDLQVTYGDPFPILDPSGAEVITDDDDVASNRESDERLDERRDGDPETGEEAGGTDGLLSKIVDDLEACEKDRPKVLSVLMREHEGVPADGPFSIDQRQMVIPGRGTANIVASFSPEACHLPSQKSSDCVGYALGYLSLDQPELLSQPGSVTRGQAFQVPPLRLDFTAYIKTAFVSVETSEEEGLTYRTAASQLLDLDPPIPPTPTLHDRPSVRSCSLHACHLTSLTATLTNNTQTPLSFQAVTPLPFLLQRVDPVSKKKKMGSNVGVRSQVTETGMLYSLPTQHNLQVKLGFQLDLALIMNNLEQLLLDESKEGILLTSEEGERKLHIHKDLLLCYTNNTVQKLPLYAIIVLPSIELSPWELDFGVCLVGQERSLKVTISNRTSSGSYWTVSYDSQKTTSDNVFEVSPPAGYLEPHVTHVSDSKTILTVYFTPPHNISYAGTFVFKGLLGEETRYLQVKGQGTYDSRQEALVNP